MNPNSKAKNPRKPAWMIWAEYRLEFIQKITDCVPDPVWAVVVGLLGFQIL